MRPACGSAQQAAAATARRPLAAALEARRPAALSDIAAVASLKRAPVSDSELWR